MLRGRGRCIIFISQVGLEVLSQICGPHRGIIIQERKGALDGLTNGTAGANTSCINYRLETTLIED